MRKKTLYYMVQYLIQRRRGGEAGRVYKRLSIVSTTDHLISWKNVKEPCKSRLSKNDAFHGIGTVSNLSSICG